MERYFARGTAASLTPDPAAHWGMAYRHIFLSDLFGAITDTRASIAPYHRRHAGYVARARVNAERTKAGRGTPRRRAVALSVPAPSVDPAGASYDEHPDVRVARKAFWAINRGDLDGMAEDLIQDAVVALQGHASETEPLRFVIARHAIGDQIDKLKVRERHREYPSAIEADAEDQSAEEDQERNRRPGTLGRDLRFWDALTTLPLRQARVVSLLRYCSVADIAEHMGITEGAVEQLRVRGVKKLQEILGVSVGNTGGQTAVVDRGENYGTIGDAA